MGDKLSALFFTPGLILYCFEKKIQRCGTLGLKELQTSLLPSHQTSNSTQELIAFKIPLSTCAARATAVLLTAVALGLLPVFTSSYHGGAKPPLIKAVVNVNFKRNFKRFSVIIGKILLRKFEPLP